jgi:hypothetical protein
VREPVPVLTVRESVARAALVDSNGIRIDREPEGFAIRLTIDFK